jgi:hypothetical protein
VTAARPVVVDTMAVSALVNEQRDPDTARSYRQMVADRPVLVSFVTVAEMRYGALKAGWGELRTRALERSLSQLVVVQPDDELIRACASLRAGCERAGHPLGQKVHEADRWIAATALRLDLHLVSNDAVFDRVDGLDVLKLPPA